VPSTLTDYDWHLVLCEVDGAGLGEIRDAHSIEIEQRMSQVGTLSFTLRGDHPFADVLLDPVGMTATGTVLVKAYMGTTLRQIFEVTSVEEVGDATGTTVAVTCAEAGLWRLAHRLVGKSVNGWLPVTGSVAAIAGQIVSRVSATSGTDGGGSTGLTIGHCDSTERVALTEPLRFTPALEAIAQLASAGSGFDYRVIAQEPVTSSSGTTLGTFTAADTLGRITSVVLEYGTPRASLAGYRRVVSRDQLATVGWSLPDGFPQSAGQAVLVSPSGAATGAGRHETTVTSGVASDDLRQLVLDDQISVRQSGRQMIELTPSQTAPQAGIDYDIGDVITARARAPISNSLRFDAAFRVYGISWSINDVGVTTPTITVVPDGI